jgi:hypothetical protein
MIVPFPLVKRTDFIHQHAGLMRQYVRQGDADIAELHLAQQLKIQRNKLKRRGVDDERIEREISAWRCAILSLANVECVA